MAVAVLHWLSPCSFVVSDFVLAACWLASVVYFSLREIRRLWACGLWANYGLVVLFGSTALLLVLVTARWHCYGARWFSDIVIL